MNESYEGNLPKHRIILLIFSRRESKKEKMLYRFWNLKENIQNRTDSEHLRKNCA